MTRAYRLALRALLRERADAVDAVIEANDIGFGACQADIRAAVLGRAKR